jgi:hypothetical protein
MSVLNTSMELTASSESDSRSAGQEISRHLRPGVSEEPYTYVNPVHTHLYALFI